MFFDAKIMKQPKQWPLATWIFLTSGDAMFHATYNTIESMLDFSWGWQHVVSIFIPTDYPTIQAVKIPAEEAFTQHLHHRHSQTNVSLMNEMYQLQAYKSYNCQLSSFHCHFTRDRS